MVYCEMQARENTAEELSSFLLARHMYPGHCGYKSNTGGKMSNLRDSCSNGKVSLTSYVVPWTALSPPVECVTSQGGRLSHKQLSLYTVPLSVICCVWFCCQVRAYHHAFYRPDNLCLIVTGQVDVDKLFTALQPFEDKIISKVSSTGASLNTTTCTSRSLDRPLPLFRPLG